MGKEFRVATSSLVATIPGCSLAFVHPDALGINNAELLVFVGAVPIRPGPANLNADPKLIIGELIQPSHILQASFSAYARTAPTRPHRAKLAAYPAPKRIELRQSLPEARYSERGNGKQSGGTLQWLGQLKPQNRHHTHLLLLRLPNSSPTRRAHWISYLTRAT